MTKEEIAAVLRSISESVAALADGISSDNTEPAEKKESVPTEKTDAAKEEKPIRLEDVRTVLSEISRSGHTAEMKALLAKHGAKRLSDVPETDYAALIAEAKEIRNA